MALTLSFLPQAASAQSLQLGLGTGWYVPGGADFEDTEPGVGLDAAAALDLNDRLSLGLGVQWSRHGVDFSGDDYDVVALSVQPRAYLAGDDDTTRPFVAARLAWLRKSIRIGSASRAATGLGAAVDVGLEVPLTSSWALEGAVSAAVLSFDDFETDGAELAGTESSGWALGLRLGVRIRP